MTRRFSAEQRFALYVASGGMCAQCGIALPVNWHADHMYPYARGGETDVLNGQALCADCNRKKGASIVTTLRPWPVSVTLRPWQEKAATKFRRSAGENFLAVATPGAGKTIFALRVAHDLLTTQEAQLLVIVVPTAHLKRQWSGDGHLIGINLDPNWGNHLQGMFASDMHGVVVTYQQVASNPSIFRRLSQRPTLAILDEIHHAGDADDLRWGPALQQAFEYARRLSLSGTPFRSDGHPIPFVTYEDNRSKADFTFTYLEALDQHVCRHVWFPSFEGRADWISGGQYFSATFADQLQEQRQNERLRAIVAADSDWLQTVIIAADEKLRELRLDGHAAAGGLVIARDQWHARDIQKLIRKLTGTEAMIAISDDPEASAHIETFRDGACRWLVAVKMVSEGVDIKRLRVGIYATTTTTELFFRQAVGRFVRWDDAISGAQDAYVYIPADPRLIAFAQQIMQERDHYFEHETEKLKREARAVSQPGDDTRGFFIPIGVSDVQAGSVVTDAMILTPEHLAFARQHVERVGASGQVSVELVAKLLYSAGAFPDMPADAPAPQSSPQERPLHEVKKKTKAQVKNLVSRLHFATGEALTYGEIWSRLEKVDGVAHNQASLDQLLARIPVLNRWIDEVRRARPATRE